MRGAFAHPLGPRYVPLLLVYPPRPLRTFASLNAHLQVHLGLGGKPRSGLRPHSLNRAASPCCGLRTSSGRFDALAVQRKAMRCPSAAISQRYCSKHPPQLCQRSSGMQTAACIQLRDGNFLMPIWTRAKPTSAPCYPEISPFSQFRNQRFSSYFGFAVCCVCPRNVHFRPCKPLLKAHRFRICAERTKPNSQQANSAAPSRYFSFSVGAALHCPHLAIPT